MLRLQTPVTDERCRTGISYSDKIMMLGSCFSENIGVQLKNFGFDVCVNPFGVLYNPVSILNSVERMLLNKQFSLEDCVQIGAGDTRFCSFSHHTSFAREDAEAFITEANAALEKAAEDFRKCNKVIITLGTSWCFRNVDTGNIVSNCLKRPSAEFVRERLSSCQTTDCLIRIMQLCKEAESDTFKSKKFIFTVSPIRHFKDGAHGNQISKAGLLLGIEDALNHGTADYFPSYEIMMDELRDYRFYAEDMCHPTAQAVEYIGERFLTWALSGEDKTILENNIKQFKKSRHIAKH